jgi:carboxypeptidase family protein
MRPRVPAVGGAIVAQRQSAPRRLAEYVVKGIVTDTVGQPIGGAEIMLSDATEGARSVRSQVDGRFEFRGVRAVPVAVRARRLGYRALSGPVRLRPDTAPLLIFVLQAVPIDIEGVVVRGTSDDSKGRLTEFYQHKAQHRFGYFLERADIERRSPAYVSELLRQLRGVQLSPAATLGNTVRLRGCRPMIWLNGLRIPDAELDEVAHPDEVEALEIYVSMTGMPARLVDLVGKCGAIVIWTR